jgi:hypothetical protein
LSAVSKIVFASALLALAAHAEPAQVAAGAPAIVDENARLEGKTYAWSLAGESARHAQCKEEWRFGANGVLTVRSGEETATKQYRLAALPKESMLALTMTLLSSDGKPDCMGDSYGEAGPPIGKTRVAYLQFLNDGSFFTCASTDGLSCYGVASAKAAPTP